MAWHGSARPDDGCCGRHIACRRRGASLIAALAIIAVPACRAGSGKADPCRQSIASARYEVALSRCQEAFEATGDPAAGLAVAQASFELGRDAQVLVWRDRLRGGPEERHALDLAARTHVRTRQLEEARNEFTQARDLHRAVGDSARMSRASYGLFFVAWSSSQYREALLRCRDALEEGRRAGEPELIGRAAQGLFGVLYEIGNLEGAAEALRVAAEYRSSLKVQDQARLLSHRGVILFERKRLRLARHAFEEALVTAEPIKDRDLLRAIHLNLVETDVGLGDLREARVHLEKATTYADPNPRRGTSLLFWSGRLELESQRPVAARAAYTKALGQEPQPEWTWRLEYEGGRAAEAAGDIPSAETGYRRAADAVERMRGELGFDELKAWLLDRKRKPLEALFRLQASRRGGERAALETLERATARSFLDAFIRDAPVRSSEDVIESAVDRADTLRELLPAIRESGVVALQPVGAVLTRLRDRHVIAYFEAEGELWIVTVGRGRVALRRVAVLPGEVADLVDRFVARPEDESLAATLGELLLPSSVLPARGTAIHVITDGAVARIPFAALRVRGHYLVEEHAIVHAPSLSVIVAMDRRGRPAASAPVLFVGDPAGDLPQAHAELDALAARLLVRPIVGTTAKRAVLRDAARSSLLHLATHTGAGVGGPWLAMADGRMTAADVISQKVGPRLVVLATCASATPRGRSVWGSLAAAFVAAGAEAVVASLWSVEDESTREFVMRFYEEGGAFAPAAALARTQRAFISSGRPASTWAPFVVVGSAGVGRLAP